jgi:hypothetical protein
MGTARCDFRIVAEEWTPDTASDRCPLGEDELVDGVWRCPRRAAEGERCPLHPPAGEAPAGTAAFEAALAGAHDVAPGADPDQPPGFIGARFGTLRLRYARLTTGDARPLDFRCASIDSLDCRSAIVEQDLRLHGATVGTLDLSDARLRGELYGYDARIAAVQCPDASFEGGVRLKRLHVADGCRFDGTTVGGGVELTEAERTGSVTFDEATIHGGLSLRNSDCTRVTVHDATVEGPLELDQLTADDRVYLSVTAVDGDVQLNGAALDGPLTAESLSVGGDVELRRATVVGPTTFRSSRIAGDVLAGGVDRYGGVPGATFQGSARFVDASVDGDFEFAPSGGPDTAPSVGGALDLRRLSVSGAVDLDPVLTHEAVDAVALSGASLAAGRIDWTAGAPVHYDLSGATIGAVTVGGPPLEGPPRFDRLRLDDCRFQGFQFPSHHRELEAVDWSIHRTPPGTTAVFRRAHRFDRATRAAAELVELETADKAAVQEVLDENDLAAVAPERLVPVVDDRDALRDRLLEPPGDPSTGPDPSTVETLYLRAKNGADAVGDSRATTEFYLRERRWTRHGHAARFRVALSGRDPGGVLTNGYDYASNGLLGAVCGYGERPRRVVVGSLLTIGLFALLYAVVFPGTFDAPVAAEAGLFSVQSFVTLIVGAPTGSGAPFWLRFMSSAEGFLGAFLVALFVFTLTRSLSR